MCYYFTTSFSSLCTTRECIARYGYQSASWIVNKFPIATLKEMFRPSVVAFWHAHRDTVFVPDIDRRVWRFSEYSSQLEGHLL